MFTYYNIYVCLRWICLWKFINRITSKVNCYVSINLIGNGIRVSRSWSYGSWIYKYLWNQCRSPLMLWVRIPLMAIQHCVIKFFSDLRQVGSFLRVLLFPPSILYSYLMCSQAIDQNIFPKVLGSQRLRAIEHLSCSQYRGKIFWSIAWLHIK